MLCGAKLGGGWVRSSRKDKHEVGGTQLHQSFTQGGKKEKSSNTGDERYEYRQRWSEWSELRESREAPGKDSG